MSLLFKFWSKVMAKRTYGVNWKGPTVMLTGRGRPASLPESAWRYYPLPVVTGHPWRKRGEGGWRTLSGAPGPSLVILPCSSSMLWLSGELQRLRRCDRRDVLSQPPAWHQKASPAVHTFAGLAHSPPAGECAQGRKKIESRCK